MKADGNYRLFPEYLAGKGRFPGKVVAADGFSDCPDLDDIVEGRD